MTPRRIRIFGLIAAALVVVAGYLALNRRVTILVDGQLQDVVTHAVTVGGALRAAGLELGEADEVEPSTLAPLRNDMVIAIHRAAQIELRADGELYTRVTTEHDPSQLLADLGVSLEDADELYLAGQPHPLDQELPSWPLLVLEVRRAALVTLTDETGSQQFLSAAPTLGEALAEQGIALFAADELDPPPDTPVDGPLSATLKRSEPLEIRMDGQTYVLRSSAQTVGEALAEAGIALQGLDRSNPEESEPIPDNRRIKVVRVREQVQVESELLPFSIEWQPDPETEIDGRSVVQLGQNGLQATRVRVRFEDGEEVSRREEGEWVLAEPVNQISGYGTNIVVRTTVVDGVEIEYWRALDLYATSYSPCRSGTSSCFYYTALGDEVKKGIAAVYLSWWYSMAGHTVYVPGYGPAKISDNGAYPDGRPWIDLGYSDDEWVGWSSWVTVYFTTPVPPANEILYILP